MTHDDLIHYQVVVGQRIIKVQAFHSRYNNPVTKSLPYLTEHIISCLCYPTQQLDSSTRPPRG